jgi:4-hydroxythreonine-4-phosphate dehydrogenase
VSAHDPHRIPPPLQMTSSLALTQGDPSGIGPELTLKAYAARDAAALPPFFVIADPAHLVRVAQALGIATPIEESTPGAAAQVFARA